MSDEKDKKSVKMFPNANIQKSMSIVWDGKQFLVRFPKEVEDYLELTKEDMFVFDIEVADMNQEKKFEGKFKIKKGEVK